MLLSESEKMQRYYDILKKYFHKYIKQQILNLNNTKKCFSSTNIAAFTVLLIK